MAGQAAPPPDIPLLRPQFARAKRPAVRRKKAAFWVGIGCAATGEHFRSCDMGVLNITPDLFHGGNFLNKKKSH